tara:strand:- start:2469 stop:3227 length:759 start_codon:yes stop_codon:yes gene_type:complete
MYKDNQINSRTLIALKDIPKVRTSKELVAFLEKSRKKDVPLLTASKSPQTKNVSYDYIYNPAGKRDPFRSLIVGRQAKIKENQDKAEKFAEFIKNVESLESINLYFYNKVKRKDPVLYKKLRSHASFFKNKKAVKQVPAEERIQKLEEYKQLISITKTNFRDTILGPLQNNQYSSLKLSGVIWGTMGSTALIEIPNGRGYSIKLNDLVGPNYGVVKKIEQDKVIVVERYVNYSGRITEKQQEIKLSKAEESI